MTAAAPDRIGSMLRHRMLHGSAAPDFLESAHEWRRLFSETWGTFLLVVVAAGAVVVGARSGGAITLSMMVVAPALMVMAIIYFMGTVSGAHLNPAVTLAFALRGNFPWRRVPGYCGAQIVGGIAAAAFLRAMFGTIGSLGATTPGPGVSDIKAFVMEILLTTGLVSTILGTASGARNIGSNGALAVGGYIALAGALGGADQRRIDEPGALLRSRPDARRSAHHLDLCRRSSAGRRDRRGLRMDPQRQRHRRRGGGGRRATSTTAEAAPDRPDRARRDADDHRAPAAPDTPSRPVLSSSASEARRTRHAEPDLSAAAEGPDAVPPGQLHRRQMGRRPTAAGPSW